jgi:hypothetical protein
MRPSMPSHRHTHVFLYPRVRACTRVWLQTNADGAADARVRAHQGIRTRLEAQAHMPRGTSLHGIYTYTHMHMHALTHTHTHMVTHI